MVTTEHADVRRTAWKVCVGCGEPFLQRPERPERCSVMCSQVHRRGHGHYLHKGGLAFDKRQGRWRIMCRDGSQTTFARAVMEAKLRRPLTADELVHHVDGDPANDEDENLLIVTRAEHVVIHRNELHGWRASAQRGR